MFDFFSRERNGGRGELWANYSSLGFKELRLYQPLKTHHCLTSSLKLCATQDICYVFSLIHRNTLEGQIDLLNCHGFVQLLSVQNFTLLPWRFHLLSSTYTQESVVSISAASGSFSYKRETNDECWCAASWAVVCEEWNEAKLKAVFLLQVCVTAWVSWPSATGRATPGSSRTASSTAAGCWSSPMDPGQWGWNRCSIYPPSLSS